MKPLFHWHNIAGLSLVYRSFLDKCPDNFFLFDSSITYYTICPYAKCRITHISTVSLMSDKLFHSNNIFSKTKTKKAANLGKWLQRWCFPELYNLKLFKSSDNSYLSYYPHEFYSVLLRIHNIQQSSTLSGARGMTFCKENAHGYTDYIN